MRPNATIGVFAACVIGVLLFVFAGRSWPSIDIAAATATMGLTRGASASGPSSTACTPAWTGSSSATAPSNTAESEDSWYGFERAWRQHMAEPFTGFTYRVPNPKAPSLRFAYVVMVLEDDPTHLCGARALMASLLRARAAAPVVAMIAPTTRDPARRYLQALGYQLREVPVLRPNVGRDGYYASMFSSINLWSLTEYDNVVKLDTDMVVLTNIDELFTYNLFAATPDYPAGLPTDDPRCRETAICQHTNHDFRAQYLNGALLVVQPNEAVYKAMRDVLERHDEQLVGGPSEQGFLNWYFRDKWFSLPHYYNVRLPAVRSFPQLFAVSPPRVYHFIGGSKPWKTNFDCNRYCRSNPTELWHAELWYRFYHDPLVAGHNDTQPPVPCNDRLILS